ncbi:hypothetical protein [Stieleria varia]|uniref:Uncharacterized protein n=1 Tax=Stieleria varia TaxID=2528005 RepID=A0A5C6AEU3_9BACT|nr:hypothetical protein [Stieleria varia]TWT98552.1 hypothetical protein Pla52n_50680 [Stieleria varia]
MSKLKPIVLLAVAVIIAFSSATLLADKPADEKVQIVVEQYRIGDLPVWTKDGHFDSEILMMYLQTTVAPNTWEARGGPATMAPYPQNASLVIRAPIKTHDAIKKVLKQHRGQ